MKVILEVGKFYRRENGVLVRYTPGDVFSASPDEFKHLEAKEQVFVRKVEKPFKRKEPDKTVADTPIELNEEPQEEQTLDEASQNDDDVLLGDDELSDEDLLAQYITRTGSWFVFEDGSKVQGRSKALEILRELYG